jgi:hypothetical protein
MAPYRSTQANAEYTETPLPWTKILKLSFFYVKNKETDRQKSEKQRYV